MFSTYYKPALLSIAVLLGMFSVAGCSHSSETQTSNETSTQDLPQPVQIEFSLVQDKTFRINWQSSEGAEYYRVLENPDGLSGYTTIIEDLASSVQRFDWRVALHQRINASYIVQSCNAIGCTDSAESFVPATLEQAIGYFKASNTELSYFFGDSVSLSSDGNTLAVSASGESNRTGPMGEAESVYVYERSNGSW